MSTSFRYVMGEDPPCGASIAVNMDIKWNSDVKLHTTNILIAMRLDIK